MTLAASHGEMLASVASRVLRWSAAAAGLVGQLARCRVNSVWRASRPNREDVAVVREDAASAVRAGVACCRLHRAVRTLGSVLLERAKELLVASEYSSSACCSWTLTERHLNSGRQIRNQGEHQKAVSGVGYMDRGSKIAGSYNELVSSLSTQK